MKRLLDKPSECPICGGDRWDFRNEEEYRHNTFRDFWSCSDCGAVWVNVYEYVRTNVYTSEEWEA